MSAGKPTQPRLSTSHMTEVVSSITTQTSQRLLSQDTDL